MTTQSLKRCQHCAVRYTYTGSGHGCLEKLNDPVHCRGCTQAIVEALEKVPRLFESRLRDVTEVPALAGVTRELVQSWIDDWDRTHDYRRVFSPLYDLTTDDVYNTRSAPGPAPYDKYSIRLSTWKQKPEYELKVEMEYDLVKGEFTGNRWG